MVSTICSGWYGHLRDEDDVRAAGDAGVERDPAGVAAHHLQDHDAVVALGGGVQAVDGVRGHGHRGVEAERVVRGSQVVVDGLRHGHHGDAHVAEALGDLERAVAADGDDPVDAEVVDVLDAPAPTGPRRCCFGCPGYSNGLPRFVVRSSVPPFGRMPRIESSVSGTMARVSSPSNPS